MTKVTKVNLNKNLTHSFANSYAVMITSHLKSVGVIGARPKFTREGNSHILGDPPGEGRCLHLLISAKPDKDVDIYRSVREDCCRVLKA